MARRWPIARLEENSVAGALAETGAGADCWRTATKIKRVRPRSINTLFIDFLLVNAADEKGQY
jgi:hypothetical protein